MSEQKWLCTDIGTRTITVLRIDLVEVVIVQGTPRECKTLALSEDEARAEACFRGPPYGVAEVVIDEYDMPACSFEFETCG